MSSSHQSKFPCIIITIIIILLFFSSFSTLLTVNLFVLFWRYFVMLNSYFVCFIIYIFFFNFEIFFVDIIFVPKIGVCFSFYPVSLIFEYEAKPHIRWPHIREYEAGESGANFTSVLQGGIVNVTKQNRLLMSVSSAVRLTMASSNGNIFRVTGPWCGEFPSLTEGKWRGALMFPLICDWTKTWVNNPEADDLRRNSAHYDVIVMINVCHAYIYIYIDR